MPPSVNVPAGSTSVTFTVSTSSVNSDSSSTISASYDGAARTATLAVNAPAPSLTTTNFSGSIGRNQSRSHTVSIGAQGPVGLTLNWSQRRSNLTLRVLGPSGNVVFSAGGSAKPKTGTFSATATGNYRFEVTNTTRRSTNYTLAVTHP